VQPLVGMSAARRAHMLPCRDRKRWRVPDGDLHAAMSADVPAAAGASFLLGTFASDGGRANDPLMQRKPISSNLRGRSPQQIETTAQARLLAGWARVLERTSRPGRRTPAPRRRFRPSSSPAAGTSTRTISRRPAPRRTAGPR
jgi:hypothetical protein